MLTVHASKGLEAPIVFLPDSCGGPDSRHEPKLMRLSSLRPGDPPVLAWARKSLEDADAVAAARAEAREAQAGEHRRLLYVAMTRAAQRLIVAGHETSRRRPPDCWYDLVHSGLADALVEAPAPFRGGGTILRFGEGLRAEGVGETAPARAPRLPARLAHRQGGARDRWPLRSTLRAPAASAGATANGPSRGGLRTLCSRCCPTSRRSAARARRRPTSRCAAAALAESAREALASKVLAAIGAPELSPILAPAPEAKSRWRDFCLGRGARSRVQRPSRPSCRNRRGCIDRRLQTGRKARSSGCGPRRPTCALSRRFAAALLPRRRSARRSSISTGRRSRRSAGRSSTPRSTPSPLRLRPAIVAGSISAFRRNSAW